MLAGSIQIDYQRQIFLLFPQEVSLEKSRLLQAGWVEAGQASAALVSGPARRGCTAAR